MKRLLKAFSGKKGWYIVVVFAAISSAFEVITSIRNGLSIDWQGLAISWIAISGWAVCLGTQEEE